MSPTVEVVVTVAALKVVLTEPTDQSVITVTACKSVVTSIAGEMVVTVASDYLISQDWRRIDGNARAESMTTHLWSAAEVAAGISQ